MCGGVSRTAPRAGLEPATLRLTAACSTIELSRNVLLARNIPIPRSIVNCTTASRNHRDQTPYRAGRCPPTIKNPEIPACRQDSFARPKFKYQARRAATISILASVPLPLHDARAPSRRRRWPPPPWREEPAGDITGQQPPTQLPPGHGSWQQ